MPRACAWRLSLKREGVALRLSLQCEGVALELSLEVPQACGSRLSLSSFVREWVSLIRSGEEEEEKLELELELERGDLKRPGWELATGGLATVEEGEGDEEET